MRRGGLAIAVILTVAPGCDNVSWGGAAVSLRSPSALAETPTESVVEDEAREAEETPVAQPERDVSSTLFAGTRSGARARLVAVGSLRRGAVVPLTAAGPAEATLEPGSELVLFSEGARVGRMTVDSVAVDPRSCFARPSVSGTLELVPSADQATRFLALPEQDAEDRPFDRFEPLQHTYDQRVASLEIARAAMTEVGAILPPSTLNARRDIQAFQVRGAGGPSIAATFLYGDTLGVGRPLPRGYSLFVMGTQRPEGIERDLVWYRPADTEGKGAPRYWDHLDWNADGSGEVLLEVFGAEHRWFAALAQRDGTWMRSFEDACAQAPVR